MTKKKYFDENMYEYHDSYFILIIKNRKGDLFYSKIDYKYLELTKSYKWHVAINKNKPRYVLNQYNTQLHRLITNCPKGMFIDHINRDSLDNRIDNLRICTMAENNANMSKRKYGCNSKYRYIEEIKEKHRKQKYSVNVHRRFRKRFYTLEDAIIERNEYIYKSEPDIWNFHKEELIKDMVQVGFGADYLEDDEEEENG